MGFTLLATLLVRRVLCVCVCECVRETVCVCFKIRRILLIHEVCLLSRHTQFVFSVLYVRVCMFSQFACTVRCLPSCMSVCECVCVSMSACVFGCERKCVSQSLWTLAV